MHPSKHKQYQYDFSLSPVHTSCECECEENLDVTNSQRAIRSSWTLFYSLAIVAAKGGCDVKFTSNLLRIRIRMKYEPGFTKTRRMLRSCGGAGWKLTSITMVFSSYCETKSYPLVHSTWILVLMNDVPFSPFSTAYIKHSANDSFLTPMRGTLSSNVNPGEARQWNGGWSVVKITPKVCQAGSHVPTRVIKMNATVWYRPKSPRYTQTSSKSMVFRSPHPPTR